MIGVVIKISCYKQHRKDLSGKLAHKQCQGAMYNIIDSLPAIFISSLFAYSTTGYSVVSIFSG